MEKTINWGIIGCGDVCEVKSGPAFSKVTGSRLVAVMRRDGAKAKDYAERHGVPKFYDKAQHLINDDDVNAIYIATPPSSHEQYLEEALKAGKPVYVEKPVTLDVASCEKNDCIRKKIWSKSKCGTLPAFTGIIYKGQRTYNTRSDWKSETCLTKNASAGIE